MDGALYRANLPSLCPSLHGRGDALSTAASELPLQLHPLADAATLRCKLAKASLRGEGWGEGRFPRSLWRQAPGYDVKEHPNG